MTHRIRHSTRHIVFLLILIFYGCSAHYDRLIQKAENFFFQGEFDLAINQVRPLGEQAKKKDILLYLLEAALIFHTQGNYKASNHLFMQANEIAEKIQKSISGEVLAFLLSDNQKTYAGENFERVLIKFYIGLNYLLINDPDSAYQYFKKLQFDLKDIKHFDVRYKQNLMARYLTAILSEKRKNYNDARVEYKNMAAFHKNPHDFNSDRLVLAMKEQDSQDIQKYISAKNQIDSYDQSLQKVPYHTGMGELIVVHQAGKAMVKKSRGLIRHDRSFMTAFHVAVGAAILSQNAGLTVSGVMSTLYTAENPIPVYQFRDHRKSWDIAIELNQQDVGSTKILNDYSQTAVKNFNDNYQTLISKNIASIAVKAVSAAVAAFAVERTVTKSSRNSAAGAFAGILTGVIAGSAMGSTIKPDLRCWHLLPSNFQVKRIFLEQGDYELNIRSKKNERILTQSYPSKIKIKKGDLVFVNIRSI